MHAFDDILDFVILWELISGEDDESFDCPVCGSTIKRWTELDIIDEQEKVFLCPEYECELVVDEVTGTVESCEDKKEKEEEAKIEGRSRRRRHGQDRIRRRYSHRSRRTCHAISKDLPSG